MTTWKSRLSLDASPAPEHLLQAAWNSEILWQSPREQPPSTFSREPRLPYTPIQSRAHLETHESFFRLSLVATRGLWSSSRGIKKEEEKKDSLIILPCAGTQFTNYDHNQRATRRGGWAPGAPNSNGVPGPLWASNTGSGFFSNSDTCVRTNCSFLSGLFGCVRRGWEHIGVSFRSCWS